MVVIGGGGAGLSAAVSATERGASVIVLEKRGAPGGNTALASGLFAAESPAQKRAMIDASRDGLFQTIMDWTHWKTNPRIVRAMIDRSGETIEWLEGLGCSFAVMPFYPNHAPATMHIPSRRAAVTDALVKYCNDLGVKILTRTEAKKILTGKRGEVKGILATIRGRDVSITTNRIIISTGGYGGNKELIKKYCAYYHDSMGLIGLPNMGDGLRLATEAGAATEGLGMIQMEGPCTPRSVRLMIDMPDSGKLPVMLGQIALEPQTVWVNKRGVRFIDETAGTSHFTTSNGVARQPEAICFSLLDSSMVRGISEKGIILGRGPMGPLLGSKLPGLERELKAQAEHGTLFFEQVDPESCNGCGLCIDACPMYLTGLDTKVTDRNECPPCRVACPAGVDMRSYVYLMKSGKIREAYEVLRESLPLPAITGRICPHPCESECARKEVDEAVNINSLERFVADQWLEEKAEPIARMHDARVAIIGSGPAGLSCAYFLTKMGYAVTVFESMRELGGMLRTAIPEYRLPRDVLDAQLAYIRDMGVEFKTNVTVGRDIAFKELQKDYQAIFVAMGSQLSRRIELQEMAHENVLWGLDFLRDINLKKGSRVKDNVVVIGGGNVAIDVALTAFRVGARQITVACLEQRDSMPAFEDEVREALREGIHLQAGWGPGKILLDGNDVAGIELIRCTSVLDEQGKFNPVLDESTVMKIDADTIILAVGQATDLSTLPHDMATSDGLIKVDPSTLETNIPGIFAGGEITSGPSMVIEAIAAGRKASVSIDRYLKGQDLKDDSTVRTGRVEKPPKEGIPTLPRQNAPVSGAQARKADFSEIKTGFDEDMAYFESRRCMTCGSRALLNPVEECRLCQACERICPQKALSILPGKIVEPLVKIADSWDGIAAWIGLDARTLKRTIDDYNSACDAGHDPTFAKDRRYLIPLATPPFYAIQCGADYLDTIGGIKINERMEVLNKEDDPIPGLFAAGIDTGGWEGDTYCAKLAGTTFAFAINSGRIAGENAVLSLPGKKKK